MVVHGTLTPPPLPFHPAHGGLESGMRSGGGARSPADADDRFPEGAAGGVLDGLPKVSHGASEKQRRDRINSMIDQLRVIGACLMRQRSLAVSVRRRRHC